MTRTSWIGYGMAVVATAAALWLWRENAALRAARLPAPVASAPAPAASPPQAAPPRDPWGKPAPRPAEAPPSGALTARAPAPELAPAPRESRLERRLRRSDEIAAMFGRDADESEAEYQERMSMMVKTMLGRPRDEVAEARRIAEEKAGVTADQRAKLDEVAEGAYAAALDYTNAAVAAGTVSPYRRNAAGLLEFAGGLGGLLGESETKIGGILSPAQQQALYDAGFDWGEYLGTMVPWENLAPPPPRP